MATRVTYPLFKSWTIAGAFGVGYKLYTYEAGTSTPLTTYQNSAGTVPHANPIVLDSLGEKEIFITAAAKFTLTDPNGAVVSGWPVDNIDPATVTAAQVTYTPSGDLVATNVQGAIDELVIDVAEAKSAAEATRPNLVIGPYEQKWGGSIAVSGHDLVITAYSTIDKTGTVQLYNGSGDTLTIPTVNNQDYYVFAVKTVGGTQEFRAYTTEAGVASDADVSAYRFWCLWPTNGSGFPRAGIYHQNVTWWSRFSENTINSTTTVPAGMTTAIDISTKVPVDNVSHILFGGQGTTNSQFACLSGVSGVAQVGIYAGVTLNSAGEAHEWEVTTDVASPTKPIPIVGDNIYWGIAGDTNLAGTMQLAIHAIWWK